MSWSLTNDNGSAITSYRIFIKESASDTYTEESVDCVGTAATVLANKECFIEIATLITSPYNIDGGDSIYAKVSATNVYG